MNHDAIVQLENKYYISSNSSYADNRIKVLNHTDTFGIFDRYGDIRQFGDQVQGIYHEGTRFISESEFRINGERPLLLSSAIKEENEILSVDLTNQLFTADEHGAAIPKFSLHIKRSKFITNGSCHEKIEFINYGAETYEFNVSLAFQADFRDIFEVRGMTREKKGEIFEISHADGKVLLMRYMGLDDVERVTAVHLCQLPSQWENQEKPVFRITLPAGETHILEYSICFSIGKKDVVPMPGFDEAAELLSGELSASRKDFAHIFTSNEQLNHWVNRSQADLITLLANTGEGRYPYAGVPWYNTAFGRDGIITAYETLAVAPDIARDVLLFLSRHQATQLNSYQDAEPGKIVHEMRGGEMVETNEIPFKQYYGSVDSTPLFIALAGAYYERTADLETIRFLWPHIQAALQWIDVYGDPDGDGFVEYSHKSENGLINQGWKDSHDSIFDENGTLAVPPIALCEVQGYVYEAKLKAARLASLMGDEKYSDQLTGEAKYLREKFNTEFWDEELRSYVIALDGNKKPCRIVSSNAGHSFFSGIANPALAKRQVQTLMGEKMFSGWGIRTLAMDEVRYNPMSYHNGSVWPHDVAMIAHGFSRYGFQQETIKLTGALFDASLFLEQQRLPELFCGFGRRRGEGPTAYPVACSPQAWSVGAVFLLIQSCLRMEIQAPERKIIFHKPMIPDFMDNILITRLKVGESYASVELHRYKNDTGIVVKNIPENWEVITVK
jgi:glycogen debranching enzyme